MKTPQLENSSKTYRIAGGKIRIGMGEGDEILDSIAGFITGFDIIEGTNDDGDEYKRIRCELELENGERVKVGSKIGLDGNASQITPTGFALGLLGCKEGDDIAIFPSLSKPDPKYGKQSTYCTVGIVNPKTGRYLPVNTMDAKADYPGERMKDKLPHILEALKKHALYRDLSPVKEDEDLDLSIFGIVHAEKKWPSPFGEAGATYLKGLSKLQGSTVKEYADASPETIEKFTAWYESEKETVPKSLAKFVVEDEYDPFGDE
jgi:hypothetical protein